MTLTRRVEAEIQGIQDDPPEVQLRKLHSFLSIPTQCLGRSTGELDRETFLAYLECRILGRSTSVDPETVPKKLQAIAAKEDDEAIVCEAESLITVGEFSRASNTLSRGPTPPEAVKAWSDPAQVEKFMRKAHGDEKPPIIPPDFLNQESYCFYR
jgi:hypothetical protein